MAEVKIVVKNQVDNADAISKQSTQLQKLNSAALSVAKGGLAAVGIAMAVFAKQSIDATSNVEETASKFDAVFGPAAARAREELDAFGDSVGRSGYELQETAAGFGAMLEGLLGSKQAAAEASVELSKLTTDLSSFYNVSEDEAATALRAALAGETEPMRRFGVMLSAAAIEAEVFASGMAKTKSEITNAMKAQATMNLIMEGTATAQGDALRTSDSYANQQRALGAAILDLQVVIGTGLIPTMKDLTALAIEAAGGLQAFFDVTSQGGDIVDGIIAKNIQQATSIKDLTDQYKRIKEQQGAWLGVAARVTGTTDDLAEAEKAVREEIIRTVKTEDEYIAAMREMGIVTNDHFEAMYRGIYAEEAFAAALAEAADEAAGADAAMLDNVVSTEKATTASEGHSLAMQRLAEGYKRAMAAGDVFTEKTGQSAEALQEAREAAEATATAFEGSFSKALDEGGAAYGRWVTTATAVGGMTETQQENFEELSAEAEKLRDNIQSLQGGTDGLGLTTDELNEKLAAQYEQLGLVEGALAPLAGMATTYTDAQKVWVVDAEALNEQLFSQIDAQSENAIVTASAAIALGIYDEAQIATALNAAIIEEKINALASAFVNGDISAREMQEQMDAIVNGSPYTSEIEVMTAEAVGNIDKVRDKLKALDGYTITTHVKVQTDNVPGGGGTGGGGATDGTPGGTNEPPNNTPGYATGGVVPGPMGAPQMAVVHGGEEVLTPAQRKERGGSNINISFAGAIFQGTQKQQAAAIVSMVAEQLGRY